MPYYVVSWFYTGPRDGLCEDPEANDALHYAETVVETLLGKHGVEFRHAYSWPDGSLVKYVRMDSTREEAEDILREIFSSTFIKRAADGRPVITDEDDAQKGNASPATETVRIADVHVVERPDVLGPTDYLTLEERFDLSPDDLKKLMSARYAAHEAFFVEYNAARDACETCRPGKCACPTCDALLKKAWESARIWRDEPRPVVRSQ